MPHVKTNNAISLYVSETSEDFVLLSARAVNHLYYLHAHNSLPISKWLFVFGNRANPVLPGAQPLGRLHLPPRSDAVFTAPPILDEAIIEFGLSVGVSDTFDIYTPADDAATTILALYSGDPVPLT